MDRKLRSFSQFMALRCDFITREVGGHAVVHCLPTSHEPNQVSASDVRLYTTALYFEQACVQGDHFAVSADCQHH